MILPLILLPEEAADRSRQLQLASQILNVKQSRITSLRIIKRSIDARSRTVKIQLLAEVIFDDEKITSPEVPLFNFDRDVSKAKPVIIVGCGPAGMFAALKLIELGMKPVIIERGKNVRDRRRDLAAINKEGIINPDSNYCFGEGGAGTYSDGKLYTRSNKRGDIHRILDILILHGADEDIKVNAHPHIGTNKLPRLVENIRQTILNAGGEIHFNTRMNKIKTSDNSFTGIICSNVLTGEETEFRADAIILATGHSARDVYHLFNDSNILIEAKPFALGVRIEHPQEIIDSVQYHCEVRSEFLPPASYSLTHQHDGRGIYSFCMCPGGIIAPAATSPGEIVVNGWSPSKRNNPFANSGMVVSVLEKDFQKYSSDGSLAALTYQSAVEKDAFNSGGGNLQAPAQRLIDFVESRFSASLPVCSYIPGIVSVELQNILPPEITSSLQEGLKIFGKKMKSFYTNDAVVVGVESRTSSPVRIPRDNKTLEHPQIKGLYPCGEGAGYAGGIVSAAMDGERCASQIAAVYK